MIEEPKVIGLSGDTLVELVDGQEKIKNLVGRRNFWIYSYNIKTEKIVLSKAKGVLLIAEKVPVKKIVLNNDQSIVATLDTKFILRYEIYKELRYLKKGNQFLPFYKASDEFLHVLKKKPVKKGVISPFYIRKVKSIELAELADNEAVYYMETGDNHNFALGAGVFSFNGGQEA